MLRVEERVATWRVEARGASTLSEEELDELEAHLRDRIDGLVAEGVSPRAAFENARNQLGDLAPIETEYRKVRMPTYVRDRLVWMLFGYVVFEGIQQAARLVATLAAGPGFPSLLGDAWAPIGLLSIHALVITCLVVVVTKKAVRRESRHHRLEGAAKWRRRWGGRRWPAAALTVASLLGFLTSALAIDYWQWWMTARHAGLSQALGFTNYWLDIFEIALAPTLAIAAILLIWNSSAPTGPRRPGTWLDDGREMQAGG